MKKFLSAIETLAIRSPEPDHIDVYHDDNGTIMMYWPYNDSRISMAKRRGGQWDSDQRRWRFHDLANVDSFLQAVKKKTPDVYIRRLPEEVQPHYLKGVQVTSVSLPAGKKACTFPVPVSYFTSLNLYSFSRDGGLCFRLQEKSDDNNDVALLIGSADAVDSIIDRMKLEGAIISDDAKFSSGKKLRVTTSGWAVTIQCDLTDPAHYLIAPPQRYKWAGKYPNGVRVDIPWTGTIHTTRKKWRELESQIVQAGLSWEGDDPAAELRLPTEFDSNQVAGWESPAPNGHLLHAYQKTGAEFCASRGMRALIGDEMGVGKTAQAIAAAGACTAPRVLVVCPANARYVWEREIKGWGGRGAIQHITSQLETLDMSARWHIVTYDLLAARAQTWRLNNEREETAFLNAYPKLAEKIEKKKRGGGYPRKVTLDQPLDKVPAFADHKRVTAWNKMMQRLRGELVEQILAVGPLLAILDEAHRVKNKAAKRTKAIHRISAGEAQMLLLTGTPMRNNEHEAAGLLGLLDAEAAESLSKEKGYTIQDIKDYLGYYMIRRTKAEVLPELPEKTRQRIDISNLDRDAMMDYLAALSQARENYDRALASGKSEAEARQSMQGAIARARQALGVAKVLGGEACDLVLDVLENKGCAVVFCAHHQVSDSLKDKLETQKFRVAVVDGRTSQQDRAKIVNEFQEGRLDVFIGGINAAGEAITLTNADTLIFVELDWVPAALLQAEDRIHRVGQRSNCQIIQLIARMPDGADNLDEMMVELIGEKIARIGTVLDEETTNIISASIQGQLHERLLAGTHMEAEPSAKKAKRKRGRPKKYPDNTAPTASVRAKHSLQQLEAAGGKRMMLRLTPEANQALQALLRSEGYSNATDAINQILIAKLGI